MFSDHLSIIPSKAPRVSRGVTKYGRIFLAVKAQNAFAGILEEMRLTSIERHLGEPSELLLLKEPPLAGKTTAATRYCRKIEELLGAEPDCGPVRLITVGEKGTMRTVWSSILSGLGDPNPEIGSEDKLKKRVQKALKKYGIQLLIIDELNHTVDKHQVREILNALKNMITLGWVSIVAMGSSDELDQLPDNDGFEARLVDCPGLPPMTFGEDWSTFCKRLDERMVADGIFDSLSGIDDDARARGMWQITFGSVGRLKWLIGTAMRHALRRDGDHIALQDLITAGDALLMKFPKPGAINPLQVLLR